VYGVEKADPPEGDFRENIGIVSMLWMNGKNGKRKERKKKKIGNQAV